MINSTKLVQELVKGESREPKTGTQMGQEQVLIPTLVSTRKTRIQRQVNHLGDTPLTCAFEFATLTIILSNTQVALKTLSVHHVEAQQDQLGVVDTGVENGIADQLVKEGYQMKFRTTRL